MITYNEVNGEDIAEVKKLLLYRKIVEARRINDRIGELVLDNDTVLRVIANDGQSEHCDAGYWYLDDLNTCDNAITNVELIHDTRNGGDEDLQIFVYAEDTRIKAIDVYGDEGNGYYGRGFVIIVEKP